MPMKDLLHRLQPVQLYIVLSISVVYFLIQLFLSHITHSLTLLVASYHMLCNIIALTGCIVTIKHSRQRKVDSNTLTDSSSNKFVEIIINETTENRNNERSLKNTFGWTRIDILTMLIVCIFLASLCFSLLVEAIQTLVHIDHQDTMHLPIPVLITGAFGFIINGICYLLIGGYTFHQGSFLHVTSSGDVILDRVVSADSVRQGERRLSKTKNHKNSHLEEQLGRRQNLLECFRDICSSSFVIVCAIIIYFANDEQVSKFVDPLISIVSCLILLILSYPYMKESCLILLQTIPGTIDIELFKQNLLKSFDDIVNVHDLHIWQLTGNKYVSTAHIIFQNPSVYTRVMHEVEAYFHEQGITIVTIQPEFTCSNLTTIDCMVKCTQNECQQKSCCNGSQDEIKFTESFKYLDQSPPIPRKRLASKLSDTEKPGIPKCKSHQLLSAAALNKNRSLESLPQVMREYESEYHLSKSTEHLHRNRRVSELGDDFTDELNAEMYDIDKVGREVKKNDEISIATAVEDDCDNDIGSPVDIAEEKNMIPNSKDNHIAEESAIVEKKDDEHPTTRL